MLTTEPLNGIIEDPISEWGEDAYFDDDDDDLEELQIGGPNDENDQKGVIDSTALNQSSRPTTNKSIASSSRSDGKRVRIKHQHLQLYSSGPAGLKRDPIIESIIESRKFSVIENPYTRLAQVTSQPARLSQRVNQFDTRPSIVALENENKERILSSHSGIKLPFSTTSEIESEGWDDGVPGEYEKKIIPWTEKSCIQLYEETCKRLNLCPCSMIVRSLNTTTINLRNYGLGSKGCAALAVGLVRNTTVLSLNLSQNNIGGSGMSHIYQILMENIYIEEYDLSFNNLGTNGIQKLADGIHNAAQVKTLNVAGNKLNASDIQILLLKLEEHPNLNDLNLSYNQLEEEGGIYVAQWLSDNNTLLHLDISWCSIRLTGAKALAKAIGDNNKLITLNLSQNSFTNEMIDLITNSLTRNMMLCELNLRDNQLICRYNITIKENPLILITGKESQVYKMFVAAATNQSLKIFRLGHNHIDARCLMIILEALSKLDHITLEELDLTGLTLSAKQISKVNSLFANHPTLRCFVGPIKQPVEHFANNLLNLIQIYSQENDISLLDIFNSTDGTNIPISIIPYEQFLDGLRKAKIPFPIAVINDIMKYIGRDNDEGLINLRTLNILVK